MTVVIKGDKSSLSSLIQSSLEATLTSINHTQTIQPMPFAAFELHQKGSLTDVIKASNVVSADEEIEILTEVFCSEVRRI